MSRNSKKEEKYLMEKKKTNRRKIIDKLVVFVKLFKRIVASCV